MTIQKRIKRLWALLPTEEVLGENRTRERRSRARRALRRAEERIPR